VEQDIPPEELKTIPQEYRHYLKVFSEKAAACLPPDRLWNHTIELKPDVLHSNPTPTFSSTSSYTYSASETWDMPPSSPTVVSEFPDVVPAHPLDILPHVAPHPFSLGSLM